MKRTDLRTRSASSVIGVVFASTMIALTAVLPISPATPAAANPATENLDHRCAATPSVTGPDVTQSGVQGVVPGETVTFTNEVDLDQGTVYQAAFVRPDGTRYHGTYLETIAQASDLLVDVDSIAFTIDGAVQPVEDGTEPDPDGFVLDTVANPDGSTTWRVYFPADVDALLAEQPGRGVASYSVPAGGETMGLGYTATVPADVEWGAVQVGSECFYAFNDEASNRTSDRIRTAVSPVLPELTVAKSTPNVSNVYSPGTTVDYAVTVSVPTVDEATRALTVAAARDVVVTDTVPPELAPLGPDGQPTPDGGQVGSEGVWSEASRTITFAVGDVQPGTNVTLEYEALLEAATPEDTIVTNAAATSFSSLPGDVAGELVVADGPAATTEIVTASTAPAVGKTSTEGATADGQVGTGIPIDFTLTVDIPDNATYENFTIIDELPDGMDFVGYVDATCAPTGPGCPTTITPLTLNERGDGATVIGWYLGEVERGPVRTITLEYQAQIAPTYDSGASVAFGDLFENEVDVHWNVVDRIGGTLPTTELLPEFDGTVSSDETVAFERPVLGVTKAADRAPAWDYVEGEIATYTVEISNTGSIDAVDIQIQDVATNVDIDASTITIDGAPGNLIDPIPGPLAPGESITITYQAVPGDTGTMTNTFQIPNYTDPGGTAYTENPSATTSIRIEEPRLAITKTTVGSPHAIDTTTPITFRYRVANVSTSTAFNPRVTDTPPGDWLTYVEGSNSAEALETAANQWDLVATSLAPGQAVTFTAQYTITDAISVGQYDNRADLFWEDVNDGLDQNGDQYTDDDTSPVRLVQPDVEIRKTPDADDNASVRQDDAVPDAPERTGQWVLTVRNTDTIPSFDITVTDPMPETFEIEPGQATVDWSDPTSAHTVTETTVADGQTIYADHSTTFSATIDRLDPGEFVTITLPFKQNGEIPSDLSFERTNTARISNPNWVESPGHTDDGAYSIVPLEPGPRITKTLTPASGGIGTEVTWILDVELEGADNGNVLHDVVVTDDLPDGFTVTNEPAIDTAATAAGDWADNGWSATCVSGDCAAVEFRAGYLGSEDFGAGASRLTWYIGEYTSPDPLDNAVIRIEFTAELDATYDDGTGVADGSRDPIINTARPYHNRDTNYAGGNPSGDVIAGFPASPPVLSELDQRGTRVTAPFDIVSPRLDLDKQAFADGRKLTDDGVTVAGEPAGQVHAGQQIDYTLSVTASGSGPAYDIVVEDDLAKGRLRIDESSIEVTPAGATCTLTADPLLRCGLAGPLALGEQVVVTYSGLPPVSADLQPAGSSQNTDPDLLENTASVVQYYAVPDPGPDDPMYAAGEAVMKTYVYTPQPEVEIQLAAGSVCKPQVGSPVNYLVSAGSGDEGGESPGDGVRTLLPYPVTPGVATGFDPALRVTIPATLDVDLDAITATGVVVGVDDGTFVPFTAPVVTIAANGDQILTWSDLDDMPHAADLGDGEQFVPALQVRVPTTSRGVSAVTATANLQFEDGQGNTERGTGGTNVSYIESDATTCGGVSGGGGGGGGTAPTLNLSKTPDAAQRVSILPGGTGAFTVTVSTTFDMLTNVDLSDTMPDGLTYLGRDSGDPEYAVATIDPPLPSGAALEDFFVGTTAVGTSERQDWGPIPTLPGGTYTITIPVRGEDPPPFPSQFLTNRFDLSSDQGNRSDTGDMFSEDANAPVITKSIGQEQVGPGDVVAYTIDVLLPSSFEDTNVTVFDFLNNQQGTNREGYPTGDPYPLSNNGNQFRMEANLELVEYVSATCIQGCSGGADDIVPQPLAQAPLVPPGDAASNAGDAGAFGWFLGDVVADPEGQARLLRFVVNVQAPTVAEMQAHMNTYSAGSGNQMVAGATQYSEVNYRNLATLGTSPDGSAWDTDPDILTDPDVWRAAGQDTVVDDDIADLEWFVPAVDMAKTCHGIGIPEDQTSTWDIQFTPVGTPNATCTITLTNPSQSTAYNVPVDDFQSYQRIRTQPNQLYDSVGNQRVIFDSTDVPWSTALAATTNSQYLESVDGSFPMEWVVPSIEPGETVELAYELRLDGWSSPGITPGGQNPVWARWYNTATRTEFTAEPDPDAARMGGTDSGRDFFEFAVPELYVSKAPITPPGQARESLAPYPNLRARLNDPLLPPNENMRGYNVGRYGSNTVRSVMARHLGLKSVCTGGWPQNNGVCNIGNITDPDAYGADLVARNGDVTTWAIGVWVSSAERYSELELVDTLPYGFDYVEGSGQLVSATGWNVWREPRGTLGYELHPLTDETEVGVTPGVATACDAANYHDGGESVTWRFDQSNPNTRQIWDHSYFEPRVTNRLEGTAQYKVLLYEAIATDAVTDCDPDTQNAGRYLMENNVSLTGRLDGQADVVRTGSMLIPVDSPVSLTKSPDGGFFPDGGTSDFTVRFDNHGTEELLDKTFIDTIVASNGPTTMPYACGTATAIIIGVDGDERTLDGTEFTESTCDITQPTEASLAFDVERIGPGESLLISVPMAVPNDEPNGVRYGNTTSVDVTAEYGRTLSEVGSGTVVNPSPPPVPVKRAGDTTPTINDTFDYTIDVVLPAGQVWLDLAYYDVVPDGYTFNGSGPVTCSGSTCSAFRANRVQPLAAVDNGDGTTSLGWWFGDVPGTAAARTYRLTYNVTVDDTYRDGTEVVADDLLTNTVDGFSNDDNQFDSPPPTAVTDTSTYDYTEQAVNDVEVQEPDVVVDKSAVVAGDGGGVASAADQLLYTVVVTNDGGIAAYDLRVSDTPGLALESLAVDQTPPGTFLVDSWTPEDPEIQFYIPALAAGASVTFTYTADIVDDYAQIPVTTADNVAEPRSYRSSPALEPAPGDRIYDDNAPTTTRTRLVSPDLDIDKYADAACTSETVQTRVSDPVTWCLVVTNSGEVAAFDPVVRDALPFKWSYDTGTSSVDGASMEPAPTTSLGIQVLTWDLDDLGPGESTTITFDATPADGSSLEVTNLASVRSSDADGNEPPPGVPGFRDSDTAGATLPQFSVEIAKTEDVQRHPFVGVGGDFVWTLTIANPLSTDLTNLRIIDFLPPPITYVPGTATSSVGGFAEEGVGVGTGPGGTTEILWTVPFLAGDDSFTIELPVTAPPDVLEGVEYVNDAQVNSDEVADVAVDQAKATFYEPASLGDRVWRDLDADGVQDPDDPGVDGVVVNLLDGDGNPLYLDPLTGPSTDPAAGPPLTTTTGDDPDTTETETGFYAFTGLPAGDYLVEFVPPVDTAMTNPDQGGDDALDSDVDPATNRVAVQLDAGEDDPTIDAGIINEADLASLGDFVWFDADVDGVQDDDQDGVNGVVVELLRPGPDGVFGTADDEVLATTTTGPDPDNPDADGWYGFDRLPPTDYQVRFSAPDGTRFTEADQGDDATDSDVDVSTGRSQVVSLAPGEANPTIDAGLVEAVNTITGVVWDDHDRDGTNDADEPPVNDVAVELLGPGPDGEFGTDDDVVLDTTTTGTNPANAGEEGYYEFTGLPDGEYRVRFTAPAGSVFTLPDVGDDDSDSDPDPTTGTSATVDLDSARQDPTPVTDDADAGIVERVNSLSGVVWNDDDHDGVNDDERPVDGVVVELFGPGPDGVFGSPDDESFGTTTTAPNPDDPTQVGYYEFTELPDGEYQVVFTRPDDTEFTLPDASGDDTDSDVDPQTGRSHVVDLDSGHRDPRPVADVVDAGVIEGINTLTGVVWEDEDVDGQRADGEVPVDGVAVELYRAGADGVFGTPDDELVATTTTGVNPDDPSQDGYYQFTGLPDGEYQVEFAPPAGRQLTVDDVGDDATDSDADPVTRRSETVDLDADHVSATPVTDEVDAGVHDVRNTVRGIVWDDVDGDGVQDAGEPPVNGVEVELWGAGPDGEVGTDDDEVIARTTTAARPGDADVEGFYEFTGLPDGRYRVRFAAPPGMDITVPDAGGDDHDSDADPSTGMSAMIDLDAAGTSDEPMEAVIDAGMHAPGAVDLSITKVVSDAFTRASDHAAWTITVTNLGSEDDPGPVTVTDPLPEELGAEDAAGVGWSCTVEDELVTCVLADGLAAGASSTIVLTTSGEPTGEPVTNTAWVASAMRDDAPNNNADSASTDLPTRQWLAFPLPITGGDVLKILGLAVLLIGLGLVVLWRFRRQHALHEVGGAA